VLPQIGLRRIAIRTRRQSPAEAAVISGVAIPHRAQAWSSRRGYSRKLAASACPMATNRARTAGGMETADI
jgi:hypothetical protein